MEFSNCHVTYYRATIRHAKYQREIIIRCTSTDEMKGTLSGVIISKLIKQTIASEFVSHWVPYTKLSK